MVTQPAFEATLLNAGLALAMAWGEDWLKPIQPRLKAQFPALDDTQADQVNTLCQAAMRHGHATVVSLGGPGVPVHRDAWASVVLEPYPWISEDNLSHLYSQGMYYAMK
jgi:hypothetical protein